MLRGNLPSNHITKNFQVAPAADQSLCNYEGVFVYYPLCMWSGQSCRNGVSQLRGKDKKM